MGKLFSKDWWKTLLVEQKLSPMERKDVITKFLIFAKKELELDSLPSITLTSDESEAKQNRSFGGYHPEKRDIRVYIKNRNLADILRTLAHELIHEKQNKEGRINSDSGETGNPIENEANSTAGILLRKFGQLCPEIYE